jgi:tripartite ATP-independent transporter DctM subunit
MFILMGNFALSAGIGQDTFNAAAKWLGRTKGGLAHATVLAAALFGAATGSSVGSAALFSRLALPEMVKHGYDKSLASACVAIAGTLAVMIPPSALMIVYAILTDQSIGELLIAGVFPGLTFAALLIITTYILIIRTPNIAPIMKETFSFEEKMASLKYVGPLIILIGSIIGGLYAGLFTPTEGGALGALFTLIIAVIKQKGFREIKILNALLETTRTSIMVFFIITSAIVFAKFMSLSGVVTLIGDGIIELQLNRYLVWFLIVVLYLFLGMILDAPSMLAVSLPMTLPVMTTLGFDPIWFGVCVILLAEIGLITPPVGVNCFVVAGAAPEIVTLNEVFRGVWPYVIAGIVMVIILTLFPEIALWLPRSMMG